MMEEIKPKKERKFLKVVGNIAKVLANELVMGIARKFIGKAIDKVGNKRQGLVIAFLLVAGISYASIDSIPYPITGNKQRLGWQTTGNGLVWRGVAADTVTKPTSYADKNIKAYLILDSVSGSLYVFKQGAWAAISGAGGFTQPIDSLFFDTSVPSNNVDTAKMRWDSELGTVVLGMYDQVPNELGFKNFWLVKNQTGSTITKGSIVYANGTVGASGRITVAKFIANGSIDAKYLLGITAHDLTDGENGYVISFGKIRQVNTDTFAAGSILYPSPTTAGVWTDVEPVAPNIDMPIGFCINSSSNNGTIAIRVASGYDLSELHDVVISSPVDKASLYYKSSEGLWRDTTATLLVSDTVSMLSNYATKAYADTTGRLYARQDFLNVTSSTLTWTQTDTLIPSGVTVVQVYRNGQILLPSQYTIPTSTSVIIAASSFKVNDNYTVIFPRGGGAGSGGGSGLLTSISGGTGILVSPDPITTTGTVSADLSVLMELSDTASLSNRINTKLNISDTLSMLAPYFRDADTSLLNLTSRFALKLNATDTASLSNRIDAKGTGTVTSVATGYGLSGGTITSTGTLVLDSAVVFSRIRDSIVDVAIGNDTIKILKQEYAPATTSVLTWTITPKFPIQLKAYILVFRNGQLLINDQYNLTDTNKITIVSNSFKVGANYTVVTVSGIGSVGSAQGNPVYPEAGIAVSTGTTWTTSIPNNSSNWNIAFNDKITNAAFTGTNTKTLTLTQYDGGTFAPTFTDLQGVTGSGTIDYIPKFSTTTEVTNSVIQESSGNIGIGITPTSNLELAKGKFIMLNSRDNVSQDSSGIMLYETSTKTATDINFGAKIMYDAISDNFEIKMKNFNGTTLFNPPVSISIPRTTGIVNIGTSLAVTGNITESGNNVLTNLDTASLSSRIDLKLNITDTASLSTRIDAKLNKTDTTTMLNPYWRSGKFSGTLPIANGGTGATSASVSRSTLDVGYVFVESTAGSSINLSSNRVSIVNSGGSSTTSIDLTTATNGRQYMIKNLASGTVISSASNVIPYTGGSAGTAILSAGNVTPQWVTLVADGTNWHILQRN